MGLKDHSTRAVFGLLALALACAGDQEIELPAPLYGQATIDYPLELWDRNVEGRTLLRVRVNDVGSVDSIVVLESSGHAAFDSAANATKATCSEFQQMTNNYAFCAAKSRFSQSFYTRYLMFVRCT